MKLRNKMLIPIILIFAVAISSIFFSTRNSLTRNFTEGVLIAASAEADTYYELLDENYKYVNDLQTREMQNAREELSYILEVAVSGVDALIRLSEAGYISTEEAQARAIASLRELRYQGTNYFWVDNTDYINIILPPNPSVEGTSRADLQDHTGAYLVRNFVDGAVTNDIHYEEYWFPRPGETVPSQKLGIVKYIEEWGWVIGTGFYVDDIQDKVDAATVTRTMSLRDKLYAEDTVITDHDDYARIFNESYPFMIDQDGMLVFYYDQRLERTTPDLRDTETGELLIPQLLEKQEGAFSYHYTKPGSDKSLLKHGILRYHEPTGFIIVYSFYQEDIDRLIDVVFLSVFVPLIISILVVIGAIIFIITFIVRNISKVNSSLEQISKQDGDLTSRISIKSKDELSELAASFNTFVGTQQSLIYEIKHLIQDTQSIKDEVSSSTEETSTAIGTDLS